MLVIRGRVFRQGRVEPLSLGVEDGRIVAIKKILRGEEVEDHGDALILPGTIDLHVHLRDPGLTHKEDFASGTRSAALGGVTTVVDMPNSLPPVTTRSALQAKRVAATGRSNVDFGLYAAPRTAVDIEELEEAAAFKAYMAETTGGLQVSEDALAGILPAAASAGKLVVVHAEDARVFGTKQAKDLRGHNAARPKESEVSALRTLDGIRGSARIHVAHVSSVEALEAVPEGATAEVTPHHLFLDVTRPLGPFGKVNPPLRSREDREALWNAFAAGRIPAVASDHAPHTRPEKEEGTFEEAPSGVPTVGASFPLLMRRVRTGDLELPRMIGALAEAPGRILGLAKGEIREGWDADLLVVDPRQTEKITAERLRYKCGWTPFDGMEGCFPAAVYVRGEPVVEGGEPSAEGIGRMITNTKR